MSQREEALLQRWSSEKPMYHAFSSFLENRILEKARDTTISPKGEHFFSIPVKFRIKSDDSLLAKAFYRGKQYTDPYNDIEDKAGLRLVVLTISDLKIAENILEKCSSFIVSRQSRDFELERQLDPYKFDYQSNHFIVRARCGFEFNGQQIKTDTACEVQMRTILQHAYSELTHDTIYKPSIVAKPEVKRAAAKSAALIEATGDYFEDVKNKIESLIVNLRKAEVLLDVHYKKNIDLVPEATPLNSIILDFYNKFLTGDYDVLMDSFLREKPFIFARIKQRAKSFLIFRQPSILLVYYCVMNHPYDSFQGSPLTRDELAIIYSDLGKPPPS